ncbi:hypothetical protein Bp8pS_227 [Bacillus phage vB_BpuM-BpSp]|nr:hypothetical protein Bp8pS_227 [Bacillus phage vB_BpuM-BpSp]
MGRFVEERDVVDKYLDNFINTTSDFSRFIEGAPNFVTYYSKDRLASTEDINLEGVIQNIGNESPIRYNKIENFPLYNMEDISPMLNVDNDGLSTDANGSAIILPDTIEPLPNEYILIDYLNKQYLFRITNVNTNSLSNRVFYKVDFMLVGDNIDILEEKQVTEEYQVVYENLGKKEKSVIRKTDFIVLNELDILFDKLRDNYVKRFYNEDFNTFLYVDSLYDNYLMKFINNNDLFIKTKTFLKNIKIEQKLPESYNDQITYEESLFYALENHDIENLVEQRYIFKDVNDRTSVFNIFKNKYSIRSINYLESDKEEHFLLFNKDLVNKIKSKEYFLSEEDKDWKLLNIIIAYLNNDLNTDTIPENLKRIRINLTVQNYVIMPCILFIIKRIKNIILNK